MTNSISTFTDITFNKHCGNPESTAAFEQVKSTIHDTHREILSLYDQRGSLTAKEVAELMGKSLNSISGRLSELKAWGFLEATGERRSGAAVLGRTNKVWE